VVGGEDLEMRDLQAAVSAAATSAPGARISIGPGVVWGGLPVRGLFPSLVTQSDSGAISFYVTEVSETSTPATLVAKSAAKPVGAQVATVSKSIPKYAAMANLTLEDFQQAESSIAAVASTLFAQAAVAQDADAVAALNAAAPAAVPAASWVAAISGGQATVAAKGGAPNLLVVPAADWAALATEIASTSGLVTPSGEVLAVILGSRVVISPGAPSGEAYVVDPTACTTVLRDAGVLVDALSGADTNTIRVVADLFASTFVTRPSGVAAIAVTAA
jgi:hypothetical protein